MSDKQESIVDVVALMAPNGQVAYSLFDPNAPGEGARIAIDMKERFVQSIGKEKLAVYEQLHLGPPTVIHLRMLRSDYEALGTTEFWR